MDYCADTWFILAVFDKNEKAERIILDAKAGKARIVIPIIVFAEAVRKLWQQGVPKSTTDLFWDGVERSEKIRLVLADREIAYEAAKISHAHNIPLVDSFVAATAHLMNCDLLISADADLKILAKKKYIKLHSW